MAVDLGEFRGVIRGKMIELDRDPGLREGDAVEVQLRLDLPLGEGLRRAAGAWAADAAELDRWLEQIQQLRKLERREIEP